MMRAESLQATLDGRSSFASSFGKIKSMADDTDNASALLKFSVNERNRTSVRRAYLRWRCSRGMPLRCDFDTCAYFHAPLSWNGQVLPLILDHTNGNSCDNRPENLRLLCPNCDSQLPTKGGKNKGRIRNQSQYGYEVRHRSGRQDAFVFPMGVESKVALGTVTARGSHEKKK